MPIEIKQLKHVYMPGSPFETAALNELSLTIHDGEFVGVIGHTGSGTKRNGRLSIATSRPRAK